MESRIKREYGSTVGAGKGLHCTGPAVGVSFPPATAPFRLGLLVLPGSSAAFLRRFRGDGAGWEVSLSLIRLNCLPGALGRAQLCLRCLRWSRQ